MVSRVNDCEHCIHYHEDAPAQFQCDAFMLAYFTMERDGECKQFIIRETEDDISNDELT